MRMYNWVEKKKKRGGGGEEEEEKKKMKKGAIATRILTEVVKRWP